MKLTAALGLTALLLAGPSEPKAELVDLRVSQVGRRVDVSFRLANGLDDELFERIQTGLPSGFVYRFGLFRDRQRWFDHRLDRSTLQVAAMYNAVTREYLVNYKQDGRLIDSRIARDRAQLERAMTRFEALPVFTLGDVNPRLRLLVKARAELGSKTVMGIVPTRIATDWVRSRKFWAPPLEP